MGFYTLIDAHEVNATFVSTSDQQKEGQLILHASGIVQEYATTPEFSRDEQWTGGIKFCLGAWIGPLGAGKQNYRTERSFSNMAPPKEVVIAMASGDKTIPVEYIPEQKSHAFLAALQTASPHKSSGQAEHMTASGSSLRLDFNEAYQAALNTLIAKLPEASLLTRYELVIDKQVMSYVGLVKGAPTYELVVTVSLSSPKKH